MIVGKITKEQILNMERSVRRSIDIEKGFRPMANKVHRSKKSYNRQSYKRVDAI